MRTFNKRDDHATAVEVEPQMISVWYEQMDKLPAAVQKKVFKMGRKIRDIAG